MTVTLNPADEPPIDTSRHHLLEERALERALALADSDAMRKRVQDLAERRAALMQARDAFNREATARRHARGEIYSAARVASLNALGPSLEELEANAERMYGRATTAADVLKAHARVHFVNVLVMARLNLVYFPADIRAEALAMHQLEEAFASAWLAAIGDPAFSAKIHKGQRESLRSLRTATRPMYLATQPHIGAMDHRDAAALGKAWNKLDELAETLGVEPLSNFIAVPGEDEAAGVPVERVVATLSALADALRTPQHKVPGKKAAAASLAHALAVLAAVPGADAKAWFDIDL